MVSEGKHCQRRAMRVSLYENEFRSPSSYLNYLCIFFIICPHSFENPLSYLCFSTLTFKRLSTILKLTPHHERENFSFCFSSCLVTDSMLLRFSSNQRLGWKKTKSVMNFSDFSSSSSCACT